MKANENGHELNRKKLISHAPSTIQITEIQMPEKHPILQLTARLSCTNKIITIIGDRQ